MSLKKEDWIKAIEVLILVVVEYALCERYLLHIGR